MTNDDAILAALDPDADRLAPGLGDFFVELHNGDVLIGDTPDELIEKLVARDLALGLRRYSANWSLISQTMARRCVWSSSTIARLRRRAENRWIGTCGRPRLDELPSEVRRVMRRPHVAFIRLCEPWPRNAPLLVVTEENLDLLNEGFCDRPDFDDWLRVPVMQLRSATASGFLRSLVMAGAIRDSGVVIEGERVSI